MKPKYELIDIDNAQFSVDVSLLSKSDELFFNATEIAKHFGKQPSDFLRLASTQEYIDEILEKCRSGNSRNAIVTKVGDPVKPIRKFF